MDTTELLAVARETIAEVPLCMVVKTASNGIPNARVVKPGPLREDWAIGFMTERHCRKVREIEAAVQFAMTFQYDAEQTYVTLHGRSAIVCDVGFERVFRSAESNRFHPGGRTTRTSSSSRCSPRTSS